MRSAYMVIIVFLISVSFTSCSPKSPNNDMGGKPKAIFCLLEGDSKNNDFSKTVKKMITKTGYFHVTIDESKTSKMLFDLWSAGDYQGVRKMASIWLESTGADVLFYGKHIHSYTFFLGYLTDARGHTVDASVIQIAQFNYTSQGSPTPGLENKLKYIHSKVR